MSFMTMRPRDPAVVPVSLDNIAQALATLAEVEAVFGLSLGAWAYGPSIQIDAGDAPAEAGDFIVVWPDGRVEVLTGQQLGARFERPEVVDDQMSVFVAWANGYTQMA